MRRPAVSASFIGCLAAFVAGVHLFRFFRPLPLLDPDPTWAIPRLVLGLAAVGGTALAGGFFAGSFFLWATRSRTSVHPVPRLELSRSASAGMAAAALIVGTVLRFVALDRLPPSLWVDDLSLISPALALRGVPADFSDSIRPAPFGVAKPYGSVGVLYLEAFRASLRAFGTNVFGLRFLAAAAGVASIGTAFLLGR